jgi:hypothetical protein
MNEVEKWQKRLKLKRISLIAIIVCLILLISIILLTIYGSNVGNFVVSVQDQEKLNLSLCESRTLENQVANLAAKGVNDMTDATLSNIPANIAEIDGSHNDDVNKRYFAYTFYLTNKSAIAVNYKMTMDITSSTKDVDSACRVMLVVDNEQHIYAKVGQDGEPEYYPYRTTAFESPIRVCTQQCK